jgi:hypothetical protein
MENQQFIMLDGLIQKIQNHHQIQHFSASVNFGSSDYFRESVNQLNTANFLNNNLSSSINYSKSFPGSAGVRLSLTANMSQNTQSQEVNLTLPH